MSKLAELVKFGDRVTLIERSAIQFLDFGLTLDARREPEGEFVREANGESLARLEYEERHDRHVHPAQPSVAVRPQVSISVDDSLKLLDGVWLPIPYLCAQSGAKSDRVGPTTWARARIVELEPGADLDGHSHRLTLAFDTNLQESGDGTEYLTPTRSDIESGVVHFALAHRAGELAPFLALPWIDDWFREIFREFGASRLSLDEEDLATEVGKLFHQGHYLNLLSIIGEKVAPPEIVLRLNSPNPDQAPIEVDLVLDVGNSRTCGILVEEHPENDRGLSNRYELALRDLTHPETVWTEPFESRVEFAQVDLGKEHLAAKSGRHNAFLWPTIARVGPEAVRLANRRRGTEGSTGLSSPKRYLWDESPHSEGWRFSFSTDRSEIEPHATGAPLSQLINDHGEPLTELDAGDPARMPVFFPKYSRSSMMMFMLAEVLTHALVQINNPAQRIKQGDPERVRRLRSIIMTVPPSMPKPERQLFEKRMQHAKGLVWKALGWHPHDAEIDDEESAWPTLPSIRTEWDEAFCAQVVYLFSETSVHFGGRPEDFFESIRRKDREDSERRITLASIDIGGGTTDLVVSDYRLDEGQGANVYILPEQRFRDGFKVAGDDLLLEIVQKTVVPALRQALLNHGVASPDALLSTLIGAEVRSVPDQALRQQLALQIMYPLGLEILKAYEQFDPVAGADSETRSIGELLADRDSASREVLDYFSSGVRHSGGGGAEPFDLLAVPLTVDLHAVHELFLGDELEICKTIRALCEMVHLYHCDVLLLSGRPSRLPGVQALFRAFLPLPPDRIVPLNGYRAGTWYPFHRDGRIDDPKTTAAVGAMLCKVGGERRVANFNFRSSAFEPYSTVRHVGLIDSNMIIKDSEVYYRDVQLDDENYELPDTTFEIRGRTILGFRQLESERWGASPLYVLDIKDRAKDQLDKTSGDNQVETLRVSLHVESKKKRRGLSDLFAVREVTSDGQSNVSRKDVTITLNTLQTAGLGETKYWLDSGSVYR